MRRPSSRRDPAITVEHGAESSRCGGKERLDAVTIRNAENGATRTVPTCAMFVMVGAGSRLDLAMLAREHLFMRRPRRQLINLGGFQAIKLGAPSVWLDLYYFTMEMGWPAFVLTVSAVFALLNLLFGAIYALLPGAIGNMTPGSLAEGFFFSAETLGTVGYGNMAPATALGHSIAVVEILLGLFFSATITGLIFARFARPRDSFLFSRNAVIGEFDGRAALMVRLASTRARPLADVHAQMSWLELLELPDGRKFRRLVELPLARANNPMMGLAWLLVHTLDEGSAMLAAWRDAPEFRLTVTVNGLDTLLATQAIGGRSYAREDILSGHEFVDAVDEEHNRFRLDLRKLDLVRPIDPGSSHNRAAP